MCQRSSLQAWLARFSGLALATCAFACSGQEHSLGRDCPELIDDMEDGNPSIISRGRFGEWFSYNDKSEGGVQTPAAFAEVFPMAPLSPPRGDSRYAVHTSGSGFTGEWGAGIGFDLQLKRPYDASAYRGIRFWARGAPGKAVKLRVNVPDSSTAAAAEQCNAAEGKCNDDFGEEVTLAEEFTLHSLQFDKLKQEGWSGVTAERLNVAEIYGIRFQSPPRSEFDFWIDDVAFLCE